jgi:putative tRNA adenosine deaminase-associated protein
LGLSEAARICHDAGTDGDDSVAVMVYRQDGVWQSGLLPATVAGDFSSLLAVLRQEPGETGVFGLVNVADEFFVAIRVRGEAVQVLLSDVTAAVEWELAQQVVEHLGIDAPADDDPDEVWPVGDMSIFADLGLGEMELGAVLSDLDAYADEMLLTLADRLGFTDVYDRALDATSR